MTFYAKINFCKYLTHTIFEGYSLYDVIVTSYINGWYLFWYFWKKDIHSYKLVVGYMTFHFDNPEGRFEENALGLELGLKEPSF